MLSFLGTAAGTIGTTIVVALMEMEGGTRLWTHAAVFTDTQQFACMTRACRNRSRWWSKLSSARYSQPKVKFAP